MTLSSQLAGEPPSSHHPTKIIIDSIVGVSSEDRCIFVDDFVSHMDF